MNGKGDKPRNCFSKKFRSNYDSINWGNKSESTPSHKKQKKSLTDKKYPLLSKHEDERNKKR